jgi:hypothetical protein
MSSFNNSVRINRNNKGNEKKNDNPKGIINSLKPVRMIKGEGQPNENDGELYWSYIDTLSNTQYCKNDNGWVVYHNYDAELSGSNLGTGEFVVKDFGPSLNVRSIKGSTGVNAVLSGSGDEIELSSTIKVNGVSPDINGDITQYIGQLGNVITDGTIGSILRISAPGPPGEGAWEQLNPGDESQVLSINSGVPIWKDLPDIPVIGVNAGEVLDNDTLIVPKSVLITDSISGKQKSLLSAPGGLLRYNKSTSSPETFTANPGELLIYDNGFGALAVGPNNWVIASNGPGVVPTYQDIATKAETLTNKSIDGFQNTLTNVIENVTINRVAKSGPVFLPNLYVGAFVDNQPVVLNDKVLLTKQFTASEQGLYLVNTAPNPPTRLDENYNSSRKRYICIGGDLYTDSIWMCNNETGSDVGGTDILQFRRVDNDAKLHAGMYQNIVSVSQTLNGTINTYDVLTMFDTASATSGSVSVNTFNNTITTPNTATKVFELEYSISWTSNTNGNKEYTLGVFVDGVLCRASESSRSLPTNIIGETSGSCLMQLSTGSTHVIDLRAKSDTASVNITTNSGHLRVKEVS